jgi:adenosine deaminase
LGCKSTIHAGEVSPPGQIWSAVKQLHASRIGHGVTLITDEKLQQTLIENNITLEMALTSNYQTNAWADTANHPLRALFDRGVNVTLNSDDPTVQGVNLTDDYEKAHTLLGFTLDELIKLNINALNAAFIPIAEITMLKKAYMTGLANI